MKRILIAAGMCIAVLLAAIPALIVPAVERPDTVTETNSGLSEKVLYTSEKVSNTSEVPNTSEKGLNVPKECLTASKRSLTPSENGLTPSETGLTASKMGLTAFETGLNTKSTVSNVKNTASESQDTDVTPSVTLSVGSKSYQAILYDNTASRELMERLPMEFEMKELHGNEKYYYLTEPLPTDTESVGTIRTGDIMLFGSDCLVLFYEDFKTTYNYTRIGRLENIGGLSDALGTGSVRVTFERNKE